MNYTLKILAITIFATVLSSSLAKAQDSSSYNPLQPGSKALQFQISKDFNLKSFSGTLFSFKRQLSNSRANRIGVSLNSGFLWQNFPDQNNNQKNSQLSLNLSIDYTWMNYVNPKSEIKFYFGYGPGINLGINKSVNKTTGNKTKSRNFTFGISGIGYAGVEWFFQSHMSLFAEYRASISVMREQVKNVNESNNNVRKRIVPP